MDGLLPLRQPLQQGTTHEGAREHARSRVFSVLPFCTAASRGLRRTFLPLYTMGFHKAETPNQGKEVLALPTGDLLYLANPGLLGQSYCRAEGAEGAERGRRRRDRDRRVRDIGIPTPSSCLPFWRTRCRELSG